MKNRFEKWKNPKQWLKLLYPNVFLILLFAVCNAALLTYIFMSGKEESPIAYPIYAWAAYTLTTVCMRMPQMVKKVKQGVYNNSFGKRYMTDVWFRVKFSLHMSLAINVLYSVFKLGVGIFLSSYWLIAVAIYYIILSVTRYLLLRYMKYGHGKGDLLAEYKKVRVCGYLVVVVNVALSVMVAQMIWRNESYSYPGFLIFAAAAYAFYSVAMSIISLIKYHKKNSPVLSAAKTISLVSALVSILALQTAMITQFGGDGQFQFVMNIFTGTVVCILVMTLAVFMIVNADRAIIALEAEVLEEKGTKQKWNN